MPTYDYACKACGHEFELFQQMSEPVKRKCPSCGKSQLQRLIGTGAGIIFKGGGFYETDYRSESYAKAAEAEKKAAEGTADTSAKPASPAKEDKATASQPDAKPATASPSKAKMEKKSAPEKSRKRDRA